MAIQTSRSMQTAPYVQSAKSEWRILFRVYVSMRDLASMWYECACVAVYL